MDTYIIRFEERCWIKIEKRTYKKRYLKRYKKDIKKILRKIYKKKNELGSTKNEKRTRKIG